MRTNDIINKMIYFEKELESAERLTEHNRSRFARIKNYLILKKLGFYYNKLMKGL